MAHLYTLPVTAKKAVRMLTREDFDDLTNPCDVVAEYKGRLYYSYDVYDSPDEAEASMKKPDAQYYRFSVDHWAEVVAEVRALLGR